MDILEQKKQCTKCKEIKDLSEFCKCKQFKSGYHCQCKNCQRLLKNAHYNKNKEDINKRVSKRNKERYDNDPIWREKQLRKNRERRRLEPAKIKQRANEKLRAETNPNYRIAKTLRIRTRYAFKNYQKAKSKTTEELLGCTFENAVKHIESLWKEGMNWENYGNGANKWNIDHIIPCASFNLELEEQQRKCFNYTNLQPLWQMDNLKKSNRMPDGTFGKYKKH